jgi:hypothetical protein
MGKSLPKGRPHLTAGRLVNGNLERAECRPTCGPHSSPLAAGAYSTPPRSPESSTPARLALM